MKLLAAGFGILIFLQIGILAKDTEITTKSLSETQDEKDWREFKEFQKMKERQEREGVNKEDSVDLISAARKKTYLYLQGGSGGAATQYENGIAKFGKFGFLYRVSPFFGLGFSVGNNSLDLKSKDTSSSLAIANLLLSAYNASGTSPVDQILFAKLLDSPNAFFYLSNSFYYSYNTAQLDFNFHFNREKFFDPYIGFGIIGGSCSGKYPCSVRGGELKLGTQLNFESFFIFIQLQGQIINIKEPGFSSFPSQHSIGSLGIGIKF